MTTTVTPDSHQRLATDSLALAERLHVMCEDGFGDSDVATTLTDLSGLQERSIALAEPMPPGAGRVFAAGAALDRFEAELAVCGAALHFVEYQVQVDDGMTATTKSILVSPVVLSDDDRQALISLVDDSIAKVDLAEDPATVLYELLDAIRDLEPTRRG